MNKIEVVARRIDRFQQRHLVTSVLFGVVKKYGDDNGGALASNIAFSAFGSVFPMLLLLVTVLGLVLGQNASLSERVLHSALVQFPVIGTNLGSNIHTIQHQSTIAFTISIVALLWTCTGLAQGGLFAMAQIWNLPGTDRPNFITRLGRSVVFLLVLALGLIVSTAVASLGSVAGHGVWVGGLVDVGAAAVNVGQFFLAFRILTPRVVPARRLIPGAVAAGILWTVLQAIGAVLVWHVLRRANVLYGTFAIVIGLLAWIRIGATLSIAAAEFNTVLAHRLWPRNFVQPPLSVADQVVLAAQASENQRRPEQHVVVTFTEPPATQAEYLNSLSTRSETDRADRDERRVE